MKPTRNPPSFLYQTVKGFNGLGGWLFDKLYVLFGQVLPERVCYSHVSGLSLTDYEYIQSGVKGILHIFNLNRVAAFAPPVRYQGALDDLYVAVAGLTVGNNPAE
jgi:hypothetical protein